MPLQSETALTAGRPERHFALQALRDGGRPGEGPVTERTAGVQPVRREQVFMPLSCLSQIPVGIGSVRVESVFLVCPACDAHALIAVIYCLKPRHRTLRLFQRCRWQV